MVLSGGEFENDMFPPPIMAIDATKENTRLRREIDLVAELPRDGFARCQPSLSERLCPFCYEFFDDDKHEAIREPCCPARVCSNCNDRYRSNVCPFCDATLSRTRGLRPNQDKANRHACPYESCKMSFQKPCALARHLRRHTGEKPYVCSFEGCGKAFAEKGNMNRHYNDVHRCERPFVCDQENCWQRFARKSHLIAHQSTQHK